MQPSILSNRVSVSVTESVLQRHVAVIHSFRVYMEHIIFDSWCLCWLLLIHLFEHFFWQWNVYFQKHCSHAFVQRCHNYFNRGVGDFCEGTVFISEHQLPWPICQTNCIYFRRDVAAIHCFSGNVSSVRNTSYLVRMRYSSSYFLVTNTFSNKLLLDDKYFSSRATATEELHLQNKQLFRTCTFLNLALLLSGYFFRRSTFLRSGISWERLFFLNS